jgi:hypothetical protein
MESSAKAIETSLSRKNQELLKAADDVDHQTAALELLRREASVSESSLLPDVIQQKPATDRHAGADHRKALMEILGNVKASCEKHSVAARINAWVGERAGDTSRR